MKDADVYTNKMLDCADVESRYQNRRLNSVYRQLLALQTSDVQIATRKAERQWLSALKSCEHHESGGGTMDDLNTSGCYLDETTKQADKLQGQLHKARR